MKFEYLEPKYLISSLEVFNIIYIYNIYLINHTPANVSKMIILKSYQLGYKGLSFLTLGKPVEYSIFI